MTISIFPATPSECAELTNITQVAFHSDKLYQRGIPQDMTPAQTAEYLQWRVSRAMEHMSNPNNHYFKAVDDETGRMVGGCGWHGPADEEENEEEQESNGTKKPRYGNVPSFMDQTYFDELAGIFAEARRKVVGERKDVWYLGPMLVHPDYQGRGIASRMLKEGTEQLIDGHGRGLDCYLECSANPQAKAVYLRVGFESVADIVALDGEYVMSAMIRKGKAKP